MAIILYLVFDFTILFKAIFLNKLKHWFGIQVKERNISFFFSFVCLEQALASSISAEIGAIYLIWKCLHLKCSKH